jgi:hypothetical protein
VEVLASPAPELQVHLRNAIGCTNSSVGAFHCGVLCKCLGKTTIIGHPSTALLSRRTRPGQEYPTEGKAVLVTRAWCPLQNLGIATRLPLEDR